MSHYLHKLKNHHQHSITIFLLKEHIVIFLIYTHSHPDWMTEYVLTFLKLVLKYSMS